jgi:hypothetical protein
LAEDSKDEKSLLTGLNLHYVDAMALNDDEKGLLIEFFVFIFSTICLESGNAGFVFSEEIIRRPENSFDDALSLLQKLMADFRSSKTHVANCSK